MSFRAGEAGAHQLFNRTQERVESIAISTSGEPDVVIYPDSGKVAATAREPNGSGFSAMFRLCESIDYWDGESAPPVDSLPLS